MELFSLRQVDKNAVSLDYRKLYSVMIHFILDDEFLSVVIFYKHILAFEL